MTTRRRPDDAAYEDDEWYPQMPKSALPNALFTSGSTTSTRSVTTATTQRRPRSIPPRASALTSAQVQVKYGQPPPRRKDTEAPTRKWRPHPLFFIGLALIVAILGWVVLTSVAAWVTNMENHWHYGYPRTAQYDVVVGHNDSSAHPSHFIALNYNGQVEVIEFPGGDVSHARLYTGFDVLGQDASLSPVTLSFQDVNGDGKLDMIVTVENSHLVFLNKQVKGVWQFVKPQNP